MEGLGAGGWGVGAGGWGLDRFGRGRGGCWVDHDVIESMGGGGYR